MRIGGRKEPLVAEVGQSIRRAHEIGRVWFVQAKELRGLAAKSLAGNLQH
jgi:hypothetical protein